jgi:hypothetical protein
MPSTDRKLELKAKTSVAQTGSQPFVYVKGLKHFVCNDIKEMGKFSDTGQCSFFTMSVLGIIISNDTLNCYSLFLFCRSNPYPQCFL